MLSWLNRCEFRRAPLGCGKRLTSLVRFVANEKWRKDFGTDSLPQTFNYKEKPEVFKYYPQYYHKTDKVS